MSVSLFSYLFLCTFTYNYITYIYIYYVYICKFLSCGMRILVGAVQPYPVKNIYLLLLYYYYYILLLAYSRMEWMCAGRGKKRCVHTDMCMEMNSHLECRIYMQLHRLFSGGHRAIYLCILIRGPK